MLTKKIVLGVSFIGVLAFIILWNLQINFRWDPRYCDFINSQFTACLGIFTLDLLFVFFPLFFFSIVVCFMRDEIYIYLKKFTLLYFFIYFLIILFSSWKQDSYLAVDKMAMAFYLTIIYTTISLILITYKSIKLRGK